MLCPHMIDASKFITHSVQNKQIFKDQCTRCFIEPIDDFLFVCLQCLEGSCQQYQHTSQHYQLTNHKLSLGIKKIKQTIVNQDDQKLIKDQQIKFNQQLKLYCSECQNCIFLCENYNTMNLDQQLIGLIDSVTKQKSFFESQIIAGFDFEILECNHSKNLKQEKMNKKQLVQEDIRKCKDCDLSSNLWLCLECGELGCGRQYFDGSGGNNHASNHAEISKHSLAVKLGTITADGQASIYCYTCNEDVMDNLLQNHLAYYGIQISTMTKTEQSVLEMTIEINQNNIQLSQQFEKDTQLDYRYPNQGHYVGLDNIGNSCYINSVVQILLNIPQITNKYLQAQHHCQQAGLCILCQFLKLTKGLFFYTDFSPKIILYHPNDSTQIVDEYQEGLKLNNFKNAVANNHNEFLSNKQQDAQEYLMHLINTIEQQEKKHQLGNTTSLFNSKQYEMLVCNSCSRYKINFIDKCQIFMTNIKNDDVSFNNLIFSNEQLQEKLNCFNCKSKQNFKKIRGFNEFSPYLFVNVNRILYDNWVPTKAMGNLLFEFQDDNRTFINLKSLQNNAQLLVDNQYGSEDVDENQLAMLLSMGFEVNKSVKALVESNGNIEEALNTLNNINNNKNQNDNVDLMLLSQIMEIGFNQEVALFSLKKHKNNLEVALDYLFNNPEEVVQQQIQQDMMDQYSSQMNNDVDNFGNFDLNNGKYELIGAIIHLGTSILCGHYICYIRRNNEWLYCNDNKIAVVQQPQLEKAVLLLFQQLNI